MTLSDFNSCLETFAQDFLENNDSAGYSNAVINLINDFYSESIKKQPETLVNEMLTFVTEVRSYK